MANDYTRLCLSFYESITQPGVHISPWLAYGVTPPPGCEDCKGCTHPWGRAEREQWMRALYNAQQSIEARLTGRSICPVEICDELHTVECPIYLRRKPVNYLGKEEFGCPITLTIFHQDREGNFPPNCPECAIDDHCPYNWPSVAFIDKCQFPSWVTGDDLVFEYMEKDCDRMMSAMKLAQPCLTPIVDDCGEVSGWVATWERYELADPKTDVRELYSLGSFFCFVQVRWRRINEDLFLVPAQDCSCNSCGCQPAHCECEKDNGLIYEVGDLLRGQICIKNIKKCGCQATQVYANYASGVPCDTDNGSIKEAIVKLAITKLKPDSHICSCDEWKTTVIHWQQNDPTAANAFARELPFGSMMGGMAAWRIVRDENERGKGGDKARHGRFDFGHQKISQKRNSTWQW
jgi:hypothetical protein